MQVYVNRISGIDDAIVSMFMSKRTWTKGLDDDIRTTCKMVLNDDGSIKPEAEGTEYYEKFIKWASTLMRWGKRHITMLRYVDLSVTVDGLHRAGQDDWDSHAMRFNNRIIRSSTRIGGVKYGYEMSDYYKDKIIPTDIAANELGIELPEKIEHDGVTYVKAVNGYIREDLKDNNDVKRGLYMLSIPSTFEFKCNLTEFAHVYKERNASGTANPEVKECCERIVDALIDMSGGLINRELLNDIKN